MLLTLVLFALPAVAQPQAREWRAGVARVKITPEKTMWMTGYGSRDHPADGTLQNLWVKALAIEDPSGRRGVLLTADLCGVTREITNQVTTELDKRHRLPRESVMVNVSHTHCSPFVEGFASGLRVFNAEDKKSFAAYRKQIEASMVQATGEALQKLAAATLGWGVDSADFAVNRRNNPEKDVPRLRAEDKLVGPVDHDVPVFAIRSTGNDVLGVVFAYACHNTTLSIYQWHGDYAGCAQEEIERRHPKAVALFVAGCGGNINPLPRREVALAEKYGRQLADAVDKVLGRPLETVRGPFRSAFAEITLGFAAQPTAQQLKVAVAGKTEGERAWATHLLSQLENGGIPMTYPYPIQAWRLGELSWVALGGETVVDYALRLKNEAGPKLWVFGYSNDVMAYIPSESILVEGGYEGKTSMIPHGKPGPWVAGLEGKIVGKARDLLQQVRAKP
ncbi:MAG: neutral/alkaline non-lysosomal ceramidase N-terminal domain-containing protein [Verrucomicrobia bacterium]|nr:neutral/alkaline non-lysosomal ceramidase N-terminal domain-containing protein [Verrucomicrobiota bacterium]